MALGAKPTLQEINTELGTTGQSLSTCISNAGKTGVWDRQSDFAFYSHLVLNKFTSDFSDSKRHIDNSNVSWINARGAATGNVNAASAFAAYLDGGFYTIVRAFFRFNFSGDPVGTITAAKLILPVNQGGGFDIHATGYVRNSGASNPLASGDYLISGLMSTEGTIVGTGLAKQLEIPLTAGGISVIQTALNSGLDIVIAARHKKDEEDTAPVSNEDPSDFEYLDCYLDLTY